MLPTNILKENVTRKSTAASSYSLHSKNPKSLKGMNLLRKNELMSLQGYEIDTAFVEMLSSQLKSADGAFLTGTGMDDSEAREKELKDKIKKLKAQNVVLQE